MLEEEVDDEDDDHVVQHEGVLGDGLDGDQLHAALPPQHHQPQLLLAGWGGVKFKEALRNSKHEM